MAKNRSKNVQYSNVTIETVDTAINQWLDKTVDAHVEYQNGDRKKVPVNFSTGERWAIGRKAIRDANGVLILPLIAFRRTGIEPSPEMSALGTETAKIQVAKVVSGKTNVLMNLDAARRPSLRAPEKPIVYEVTTIPFPDRSVITYDLVVQTQYLSQMNTVLEKIFHELDLHKSFVASIDDVHRHAQSGVEFEDRKPFKGGYFVGFFDSALADGGNLEEFTDQERIIKFTTTFRVPVVMQLDTEGEKSSLQVERTSFDIKMGVENVTFVDNPEEIELIFAKGKPPTEVVR